MLFDNLTVMRSENRLVSIEKSDMKLEFVYDYTGRRIEKKVYSGSTGNWTLSSHKRFVYNGYRLVQTLDAMNSNAPLQEFTWSLDDELRAITDKSTNEIHMVHHDANRNVTELTDTSSALSAHYEYGPFGQITVSNGTYASTNPFRFSSEYFDDEPGLVYYNYRYYSPALGRWTKRDDIAERGGWNLYIILTNNTINITDHLGRIDINTTVDMMTNAWDNIPRKKSDLREKSDAIHDLIGTQAKTVREKVEVAVSKEATGSFLDKLDENIDKNNDQKREADESEEARRVRIRREQEIQMKRIEKTIGGFRWKHYRYIYQCWITCHCPTEGYTYTPTALVNGHTLEQYIDGKWKEVEKFHDPCPLACGSNEKQIDQGWGDPPK